MNEYARQWVCGLGITFVVASGCTLEAPSKSSPAQAGAAGLNAGTAGANTPSAGVSSGGSGGRSAELPSGGADSESSGGEPAAASTAGAAGAGSDCAGACACPSDAVCSGACVDTSVDDANCGGCDNPCGPDASCSAGACQCPGGLTFCNHYCVDVKTDARHCGSCGAPCDDGAECVNGACKLCSSGCAVLSATVADNASMPYVDYSISLNPPVDLVGATITARFYVASSFAPAAVRIYYRDSTDPSSSRAFTFASVSGHGWFDVEITGTALIDYAHHVDSIGVSLASFTGTGTAVVYLDSISISSGVAGPWNFATSASPLAVSLDAGVDANAISGVVSWRNN